MAASSRAPRWRWLGLSLLGAAACTPTDEAPSRVVETVVRLTSYAPEEQRQAYPGRRNRLQDSVYTEDFLFVQPGGRVDFEGLDAPAVGSLAVEICIQGPEDQRPQALLVTLELEDGKGRSLRVEERLPYELHSAQNGVAWRHEYALEAGLAGAGLSVQPVGEARDGAPGSEGLVLLLRPTLSHVRRLPARSEAARRQVLLVTLDTLRADVLGCYGMEEIETPVLDALAAEAVLFENCFAPSNVTKPSHTSIFTSLYAKDHGVIDNYASLGEATPTLVEKLSAEGLRTGAFVAAFNFSRERSPLLQRFDDVSDCKPRDRRAEDVNADAIPWLIEQADQDFFAWVHYFDAHAPYAPPYPWNLAYHERDKYLIPSQISSGYNWFGVKHLGGLTLLKKLYMAEVSYLDHELGRLLDTLRALERYDEALVIVTADHGEALGELGFKGFHQGLGDATTKIPLIVKPPRSREARRLGGLVSTVDLYPTVFDYLDLPITDPLRGTSLRAAIETDAALPRQLVFSEHAHELEVSLRTGRRRAVLGLSDHEFHEEYSSVAGRLQLFDPSERAPFPTDLATVEPEETARLKEELEAFLLDRLGFEADEVADEEYLRKLRELGYFR